MTCLICGAKCKCKRATPGLCCGCHRHKVRSLKVFVYSENLPMGREAFFQSLEKHREQVENRALELQS
jgi:hypothetical protein